MSRRGSNPHNLSYHSPSGHGSSGDEGFRSPRPQYQSSPRAYGNGGPGMHGHQPHGPFQYHSGMSPIPHMSPQVGPLMSPQMGAYSMGSPSHNPSPNFQGRRGRGRGGRFHSNSPHTGNRQDSGGADIRAYFHPSMLEDPWQKLEPVPVSQASTPTT